MKLRYYLDKKGNKIYTLKEEDTKEAHYKFLKLRGPTEDFKSTSPDHP
jgi:hypothetical protein